MRASSARAQAITGESSSRTNVAATNGPLRVSSANGRYFVDASGKPVYLTGMHNWDVLQDSGESDPPPAMPYESYLNQMAAQGQNLLRLWSSTSTRWAAWNSNWYTDPLPFARTGPGNAGDGKPKFDLTKLNQAYFDRLRARVILARSKGIYIDVMLFNGWDLGPRPNTNVDNPWRGNPFNADNNINGIDGDADNDGFGYELHSLNNAAILELQKAYARKVIDTVNDLDNVIYEISNESLAVSVQWQYEMVRFVKSTVASKPMPHPVGMTAPDWDVDNAAVFNSPADWVSPSKLNGYEDNPPSATGNKVVLADTDHIFGVGGDAAWVWKSFTRGLNPIWMDDLGSDDWKQGARMAMGKTRAYALRMNLLAAVPRNDLASSGYALVVPKTEYLVFKPNGGSFTVNLSDAAGSFAVEWHNVNTGQTVIGNTVTGGKTLTFNPPFGGHAVLYLRLSGAPANFIRKAFLPMIRG